MKKSTWFWIGGVVIALALIIYAGMKIPSSQAPVTGTTPNGQNFHGSFTSGFEGSMSTLTYDMYFDSQALKLSTGNNVITLQEKATGRTHTISFFNNDGAGFSSSAEFWQYAGADFGGGPSCLICTPAAASLHFSGEQNVTAYKTPAGEWIIFRGGTGFVIVQTEFTPSVAAAQALQSLKISVKRNS